MTMKTAYRIRIARDRADRTYIVRADSGRVDYMSGSGVPLALSNLVGCAATELRFQLEDAKDGQRRACSRGQSVDRAMGGQPDNAAEAGAGLKQPRGYGQWAGIGEARRPFVFAAANNAFSDGQHSG